MANNIVFKELLIHDINNDNVLDLKSDFRAEANNLKFNAPIEYDTINSKYGMISKQKNKFVPQNLKFVSHNVIKKSIVEFQDFFHTQNEQYQLKFKMANSTEYQYVFCRLDDTLIEQIGQSDLFRFTILVSTETPYFVIDAFSVGDLNGDVAEKQIGDNYPVRFEHRFSGSAKDNLVEMPLDFTIRGDLGAFLIINMYGESVNPEYGINKLLDNQQSNFGYRSKNVTIKKGSVLSINTYLLTKKIELDRKNVEQDRFFKFDTFKMLEPFPKQQKIVFSKVPYAEVQVCSIIPNLRFDIYE